MRRRGWTAEQIDEALADGEQLEATNSIRPANGATRFVHHATGRSVVRDDATQEIIHVGGDGYVY